MARRPGEPGNDAASGAQPTSRDTDSSRIDTLRDVLDRCKAAQATADGLGEKFLSYLLGMAIEETRTAVTRAGGSD